MKFAEGDKVVTDSIDIVTKSVVKYMIKSGRKLCTAESCTGGMISQTITSVSGASEMFLGGACTYTEEIKMKLLNVKKETLEQYTVYSEQTASEMSKGALELFLDDPYFFRIPPKSLVPPRTAPRQTRLQRTGILPIQA